MILTVAVIDHEKIFRKNMKIPRGISFSEDVKNFRRVSVVFFGNSVFRTKLKLFDISIFLQESQIDI